MCFDYNTEYFLVLLLWASGLNQRWFWLQRTLGNIWRNIWLSYLGKCNWNKVCWGKGYCLTKLKCTVHRLTQGITYHNINSGEVEKHCSLNKHFLNLDMLHTLLDRMRADMRCSVPKEKLKEALGKSTLSTTVPLYHEKEHLSHRSWSIGMTPRMKICMQPSTIRSEP